MKIGTIRGIKISIHWSFWLLLLWIVYSSYSGGANAQETIWSAVFVLTIFLCVVLHELGHAFAAQRYGIKTRDITLLPIGGVARLERMPERPAHELVVAIAGPLVNVAIVIMLLPLVYNQLNTDMLEVLAGSVESSNFLLNLFIVNISLTVFNLLPAFPMDGGRVLRAILAMMMPRVQATRIAAGVGQLVAVGFFFIGIYYSPMLILIAIFVFFGAQSERAMVESDAVIRGFKVKDAMMSEFPMLHQDDTISDAVNKILEGQNQDFLVRDDARITGTLHRDQVIRALSKNNDELKIADIMQQPVLMLDVMMPLHEAFAKLQESKQSMAPVTLRGEIIGAINMENIAEFMMIRKARHQNA